MFVKFEAFGIINDLTRDELGILNDIILENDEFLRGKLVDGVRETNREMLEATIKRVRAEIAAEKEKGVSFLDVAEEIFAAASRLGNALASQVQANKAKELSAVGDNAAKRLEIEEKFAEKERKLSLFNAILNGAEGITQIWAKWAAFPAVAGVLTGIEGAAILAQVAAIKNAKFAEGEIDINGPSHSRGGIHAEIEGGESVINKRSTAKYKGLLEAINQDDKVRIMDAMNRDRKITASGGDPYNRKIYEFMVRQENAWEDNEYYHIKKGNRTQHIRKNA